MKKYLTGLLFVVSLILFTSLFGTSNVARSFYPQELMVNGGFESGWTQWQHVGVASLVGSNPVPHSGLVSARLATNTSVPNTNAVAQTITIPSDVTSATLSYWYLINTPGGPYSGDIHFIVTVRDTVLPTTYFSNSIDLSATSGNTGWITLPSPADLIAAAGRSVTVSFAIVSNDGQHPTIVGVDDVSIATESPDVTPPTTTASVAPVAPDGDNGYYVTAPTVTLTAVDDVGGSGVASTSYSWDGVTYTPYAAAFTVPEGTNTLWYYSSDFSGNSENPQTMAFNVDTVSPVLAEVTPVPTPTNTPTPSYTFNATEAGTVGYAGGCDSTTLGAALGDNTITFNPLLDGTYTTCAQLSKMC